MSHQSDPTPQTPSPAALQILAPVTLPATAHQNKWTKSREKNHNAQQWPLIPDLRPIKLLCCLIQIKVKACIIAVFTMYVGKVLRLPASGLCIKGPSKTPFLSMCRRSRAYMLRFFLPVSPEPQVSGSHNFLIHSAHRCRSVVLKKIHFKYVFK